MSRSQVQRRLTVALSTIVIALGLLLVLMTLILGGGPLARGVFIGLLFVAIGTLRLWIAKRAVA